MKDYYKILEVSRSATQDEIKKAYRSLAFKFHPDRNSDPYAAIFIKEINEAYDTLGDEQNRAKYNYRFDNKTTYYKTTQTSTRKNPKSQGQRRYYYKPKQANFNFPLWSYRAKFLSAFILLYCVLLSLDYFIATDYKNIHIEHLDITHYKSKRGTITSTKYLIESKEINFSLTTVDRAINEGDTISVRVTPFFGNATDCSVKSGNDFIEAKVYTIYSPIYFLVLLAIGFCVVAHLTKSPEQSLTCSIASLFVFLIILLMNSSG